MENATRALAIAGGILIALLVVSLLVLGIGKLSSYYTAVDSAEYNKQIRDYNKQFETYNKNVVKGIELVSLCNLAEDTNNDKYRDDYREIKLYVKPSDRGVLNEIFDEYKLSRSEDEYSEGEYYDLLYFYKTIYKQEKQNKNDDMTNKFERAYFDCDEIIYDDSNAKVKALKFQEIYKR